MVRVEIPEKCCRRQIVVIKYAFIVHISSHAINCSLETTGLYKFNRNSMDCIVKLKGAMDDVVGKLLEEEESDAESELKKSCDIQGS